MFARKTIGGIIDWDGSYTQAYYHSGKTDCNFGHYDYQNASGLGLYHWHHGEDPHLHPHIAEGKSLIDLFKSYNGSACTTIKPSSGAVTYIFEGIIELEKDERYFTLEINGLNDSFYLISDKKKEAVESFLGTDLNPVYVKRDDSPWSGVTGGFDILVDADYFKALIKKYCGLEWLGDEYPYVDIPLDERNLGTIMSYMGWHLVTSKTSPQYKLKEDAKNTDRYSISMPEYYAMVDSRIVIATKPNIGGMLEVLIGDYVDVTFQTKDGAISTYNCILGDFKGGDAPNTWGHYDGKGVVEIIYHDYNPPDGYNKNANNPWGTGNVLKITKVGNYYTGK